LPDTLIRLQGKRRSGQETAELQPFVSTPITIIFVVTAGVFFKPE
jgi:hypothetical protein